MYDNPLELDDGQYRRHMDKMIELKDVSFHYGEEDRPEGKGSLSHINLMIPDGQVILLCGESGCGKTTITRLINGLIPHFYEGKLMGSIRINGKEVSKQPLYETGLVVGTVFQNPRSQFFNVDTNSELAFGLENRGEKVEVIKKRVMQTVNELKMTSLLNRSIFKLSGGEKQKIACGCVSTCSPEILVLDEPSANLDLQSMRQLKKMIEMWKSQGKTIVIAEHRLAYIWSLIDRVIYLKQGKIVEDMDKEVILRMRAKDLHERGLRSNQESLLEQTAPKSKTLEKKDPDGMIYFKDLQFGYDKKRPILKHLELSIPAHEITAIVGHNGVGKSTLLRCISGLEPKCKGTMEWKGKTYNRKQRLNEIFLVMQDVDHQLFTESVLDEVLISMKEENEQQALEILKALDLLPYKDCHPISLSGGQKQRVAIATAMASMRKILLFDEPTSGLDYAHMLEVAQLFKKLKDQGKTLIVVTHDLELIETLKARQMSLEDGVD